MKHLLLVLSLLLALAGCSRGEQTAGTDQAPSNPTAANGPSRYLAYQHSIRIEVEARRVAAVFEAGLAACRAASDDLCTVLESRIDTGRDASASLKFRAKSGGIRKLIAALSSQAEVTDRSTTAEDLAAPIEDIAKKQAMLSDYRSRLEALRGRADIDVDALIKVSRELAQVQSEFEDNAGKQAHLIQRVETEILDVAIRSVQAGAFWRPISDAISDFGANFSQGVAAAVTAIALLLPWAILLVACTWIARKLWRGRGQKRA